MMQGKFTDGTQSEGLNLRCHFASTKQTPKGNEWWNFQGTEEPRNREQRLFLEIGGSREVKDREEDLNVEYEQWMSRHSSENFKVILLQEETKRIPLTTLLLDILELKVFLSLTTSKTLWNFIITKYLKYLKKEMTRSFE
jgi:hypothetical protein